MKKIFLGAALAISMIANAQDTTKKGLIVSGYAEIYYSYDFNKPPGNSKAPFLYSFNRSNEVSLNLGFIKAAFTSDRLRASLALGAGSYMNANLASEPGVLKNIYEANAGIKISHNRDLWIDAGIFASHIGFESAVGKDCWDLTRSILAENSPYYESGVKLSYTSPGQQWFLSALLLNGWQRIQRPDGNTTPAAGTQVTWKPSDKVVLNYSTFIGNDKPDSLRQMRYFNDFYGIFQLRGKWAFTAGIDYGLEQKTKGSSSMNTWYAPVLLIKFAPDDKNTLAARGEYYSDPDGVIVSTGTPNGCKIFGWSVNYDRRIIPNAVWRIEIRGLNGKDGYFLKTDNSNTTNDVFITTSLAIGF